MRHITGLLLFIVLASTAYCQDAINRYEYWFNNSYAEKTQVTVNPAETDFHLETSIAVSPLPSGINLISIRFGSESGYWSPVVNRFFEIRKDIEANSLSKLEYWFNFSYTSKTIISLAAVSDLNVTQAISTASLPDGINVFSYRFRDSKGLWSPVQSKMVYKVPEPLPVNKIVKYEYWFDFSNSRESVTINPAEKDLILIEDISTSSIEPGVHSLSLRFQDESGKWSPVISKMFFKVPEPLPVNKIVKYEYWFDFSNSREGVTINPTEKDLILIEDISTSSIELGVHSFCLRFQDESGKWSPVISKMFFKVPEPLPNNEIVKYEYWFDYNNNDRISVSVDPAEKDFTLIAGISASSLETGVHVISLRTQDATGKWSPVMSKMFSKLPPSVPSKTIVGYEYWFDMKNGERIFVTQAPSEFISIADNLSATALSSGVHSFHIRFKDSEGLWSSLLTKFFVKVDIIPENQISGYRYWINGETFNIQYVELSQPTASLHTIINIDARSLTKGYHTISIQYNDLDNKWSQVSTQTFFKAYPIADFSYSETTACDNLSVTFSNISTESDTYLWDFGDGNTSTDENPTHYYSSAGIYSVSLTATDNITGNTNTKTLSDLVKVYSPVISLGENRAFCDGENVIIGVDDIYAEYIWNDDFTGNSRTISEAGAWTLQVKDEHGCFSNTATVETSVFTLPQVDLGEDQSFCFGGSVELDAGSGFSEYHWSDSYSEQTRILTESANLSVYVVDGNGCESVPDFFNLEVRPVYETTQSFSECDGFSITVGTNTYSTSGNFTDVLTAINGCDSTITTNITIKPVYSFVEDYSICEGEIFTWQNADYSDAGSYVANYQSIGGCDSIYTLNLTVNPVYSFSEAHSICEGETFTWQNTDYPAAGTYTANYQSISGCDSIYTLALTVEPVYSFTENHSVCEGETFTWHGVDYTEAGNYTANYQTINGCDSIYALNLSLDPAFSFTEAHSICEGESYKWRDVVYDQAGTYTASFQTVGGCDSIYTLNLTINPVYSFSEAHSICEGETFTWQNTDYTAAGTYTANYQSISGCDSIYTLDLTVEPVYSFTENHSVCEGETFTWHGVDYTEAGTYTANYQTINGCDSIYTLYLSLDPAFSFTEAHSICEGESYTWRGVEYDQAGTYTTSFQTVGGCDSIYTLNLTVNSAYSFSEAHSICEGETFTWQNTDYTEAGDYAANYQSISGCDSIYTLALTVEPVYSFTENHSVCEGETYTWQGVDYTEAGIYTTSYQTIGGCDSVYILNLSVDPVYSFTENQTICYGDIFSWQGEEYAVEGIYTAEFTSTGGCDSVYVLELSVVSVNTSVEMVGNTLTAAAFGVTYQWVDCNNGYSHIPNETNQSFTPVINGVYAVIVTDGSCSDTSSCFAVNPVGIDPVANNNKWKVYPNPTSNFVNLSTDLISERVTVKVISSLGNVVFEKQFQGKADIRLEIKDLVPGNYNIFIDDGIELVSLKLVKIP